MAEKPIATEVIIIRRSLAQSIVSDVVTFLTALSLVGLGVVVASSAMQWLGAIMFFIVVVAKSRHLMKSNQYTIPQARARLDELEADQ